MDKYRIELERIKRTTRAELERNTLKFSRAIDREVNYLIKKYSPEDLQDLEQIIRKRFHLPATESIYIRRMINDTQLELTGVWDDFFHAHGVTGYEVTKVLQKVSFKSLEKYQRESVLNELERGVKAGLNFKEFSNNLIKKRIGVHHARTLANTAIAQFDNGYMHEVCEQAGIDKFLYDGMTPQRPFCVLHYKRVYTRAEIEVMDNGCGLPVMTAMGGYNCVHYWTPEI